MNFEIEHDACGIGTVVQIDGKQSYDVVDKALHIVEKLEHRAGKDASGKVGDGVGILLQISDDFFKKTLKKENIKLPEYYGVGMFFLPRNKLLLNQHKKMFEKFVEQEGCKFITWRKVPCNESILGQKAKDCMPNIYQAFIERPQNISSDVDFDKVLYVIRREFEKSCKETYIASLSSRTIVYKGMFLVSQLRNFYLDLQDKNYKSAIAIVHSRFSTNTTPSWQRAHPNRFIAHNGEINTIRANVNKMLAREESMHSEFLDENSSKILPIINTSGSDSAMLDNALEFLVMNGMPLEKAVMILIPEPWKHQDMDQKKKDFYHYYATMMEPWDGPAAILFSDGEKVGAVLDRNGLRPSRYYLTSDNMLILSSEVGVLDIDEKKIVKKSRLEPGKMLLVDTKKKELIEDYDLKNEYASSNPYGEWLDTYLLHLKDLPAPDKKTHIHSQHERDILYKIFGYTYEDVKDIILPMARVKLEPTSAMGTDIPLAIYSKNHLSLFHYFKQLFAQVTNPPIDSLREEVVTDTTIYIGSDGNLLKDKSDNCTVLEVNNPILTSRDMDKIRQLNQTGFKNETISLLFYRSTSLKEALDNLFIECDKAYRNGANILILSDKGVDEGHMAIPSLLAVSALEQHLVKTKKKTDVSIIVESGEPRDVHQFATLLGYGATAIYPYLAHECIEEMIQLNMLDKEVNIAIDDYNEAILKGIVKIAAKMGISTLQSYQGAQIFEAIGISKDVIDTYFTNTISEVEGITLEDIEKDLIYHHDRAYDPLGLTTDTSLDSIGFHKLRKGDGKEDHLYSPETIVKLQRATQTNDYDLFKEYSSELNSNRQKHHLRSQLHFKKTRNSIPLSEVESEYEIVKRFKTGAMSYGSISEEAHTCMAIAMNRLGGKSNSGEGGEKPERLGTEKNSAIKQVASGRFGVTEEYLVSAKEIQIKMAQGAKPGEGGHLPGKKVYPLIAKTRYSTPGVSLISPPPHHDIYSIEDLAQLIYDLKNANPQARISVKLVSEAGVGTIASGVAKAGATVVLISGYDGGTGAASQSSIHHAGLPWELGLAQAHQNLVENGLRSRVLIETDGKLMTGKDVAIACLLGAEEFGFATAPLVTMGCMMMRVCNLDTCPFGVATQNQKLRKRFKGKPEYVMNFMLFIARELREIMADLGYHTIDEMVGHTDNLEVDKDANMDYSNILMTPYNIHYEPKDTYNFELEKTVDMKTLLPKFEPYFNEKKPHAETISISSTDRTVGTILSNAVTKQFNNTLEDDTYTVHCNGGAGQSFGAFAQKGITLDVHGDANDYFGKGLSGGKLIIQPKKEAQFKPNENVIIGNVALYGATSGEAYIRGMAGERFAVRNSGASAVVEGVGDHGLEYMTGGTVVILGQTGKNLAAGMSGGVAYVYDPNHDLYMRLNKQLVNTYEVTGKADKEVLEELLNKHYTYTNSDVAKKILSNLDEELSNFKKIVPKDYEKITTLIQELKTKGYHEDEASLMAFEQVHA
ncbi:glutamate synthase large subunit [Holdemanella biformis]|uniref:Glutamate synthase large subunit n=1 Tax=Holdemanella biformis TaxID=1735 RepID=A0A413CS23_9FIRM|nr:glutamate synthase large subunit [Holdemanella biformis]RGW73426.1 glutamate synthase large subunit [Holdemanella biformis]